MKGVIILYLFLFLEIVSGCVLVNIYSFTGYEGVPIEGPFIIADVIADARENVMPVIDWGDDPDTPDTSFPVLNYVEGSYFNILAPSHTYLKAGTFTFTVGIAGDKCGPVFDTGTATILSATESTENKPMEHQKVQFPEAETETEKGISVEWLGGGIALIFVVVGVVTVTIRRRRSTYQSIA